MFGFLKSLFKNKKDKDVEELWPIVDSVNEYYAQFRSLTDDELRNKSDEFRDRIKAYASEIESAIVEIQQQIQTEINERNVASLSQLFDEVDRLKKQRNDAISEILLEIMPEAFAVVRETCRRWVENKVLTVTATDWDREMARYKSNVVIDGDKAHWHNRWKVRGNEVEWDMVHYDVQIMGGTVLHTGRIAEMATGEGKTLVSTLPSYLNALTQLGVHVVTVNDYLARRDCEWNAPLFEFHKISVDCIDNHEPNTDSRRQAYAADITYGTNNEFGFDYLRDNMVPQQEQLVQRDKFFAIVDEIDSILIDEARTPLIIAGPSGKQGDDERQFFEYRVFIDELYKAQLKVVNNCLIEAKRILGQSQDSNAKKEGGLLLFRAHRGLPKYKPMIKFLSETGMRQILNQAEAYYIQDHNKNMHIVDAELYFSIDEKNNQIELTEKGHDYLSKLLGKEDFFVIPDLASKLVELDQNKPATKEEYYFQREEIVQSFAEKSELIHTVNQLLKAYALFENEIDYIVQEGKVMIVDEHTGRVLPGRRYSDGLHQAIEAKENVKIEESTVTFATVTLQNYFRMYYKLAGMTGTAETEAGEFFQIYKLDVTVIPTNRPCVRKDDDDLIYRTRKEKYRAMIDEIQRLRNEGRPVLVGTTSVEVSEVLSRMLKLANISHNVLNAKYHEREAEIVSQAGKVDANGLGTITIATNMAGRGTDIKLGPGVRENGGLAIIGSERHDSRRIDRQLRGRAGRQGDPGSSQFFVSLEDDLMRMFAVERIAKVMDMMKVKEGEVIQHGMITKSIENAQKKVEENNFAIRKRLLEYDDVMNKQREVIYGRRRNALSGDRMTLDLDHMLRDMCSSIVEKYAPHSDAEGLQFDCLRYLSIDPEFSLHDFDRIKVPEMTEMIYQKAREYYWDKVNFISSTLYNNMKGVYEENPNITMVAVEMTDGSKIIPVMLDMKRLIETEGRELMTQLERAIILQTIDDKWKNHLQAMDDLKQEVGMASIEQKDPLLIYKFEAFNMFQRLLDDINQTVIYFLWKADMAEAEDGPMLYSQPQQQRRSAPNPRLQASHPDFNISFGGETMEVDYDVVGEPVTAGGGREILTAAQRAEMAEQVTALTQRKFNYNLKKATSKNPKDANKKK